MGMVLAEELQRLDHGSPIHIGRIAADRDATRLLPTQQVHQLLQEQRAQPHFPAKAATAELAKHRLKMSREPGTEMPRKPDEPFAEALARREAPQDANAVVHRPDVDQRRREEVHRDGVMRIGLDAPPVRNLRSEQQEVAGDGRNASSFATNAVPPPLRIRLNSQYGCRSGWGTGGPAATTPSRTQIGLDWFSG
jgi:hypothetical protein